MDYESVLGDAGGCGRYQLLMFLLLSFTALGGGWNLGETIISTSFLKAYCVTPWTSNEFSSHCFVKNGSHCQKWVYDKSVMYSTIISEFGLFCNRTLVSTLQAIQPIGLVIGMMLLPVGDRVGRRWMIISLASLDLLNCVCLTVLPTLLLQFIFRFFRGITCGAEIHSVVWLTEVVTERYRMRLGANFWVPWCIGIGISAGVAKATHQWRLINACSLSVAPFYLLSFCLLLESPWWLLTKGRTEEAITNLNKMARWNGKQLAQNHFKDRLTVEEETLVTVLDSYKQMLKNRATMLIILVSSFGYFTVSSMYFVIALHPFYAFQNMFLNVAILGLLEAPSYTIAGLLSDSLLGRRISACGFFLISGLALITVPHVPAHTSLSAFLGITGKMSCSACYACCSIWFAELMPVVVRGSGIMTFQTTAALGGVIAPYIFQLATVQPWLPGFVIGCCGLLAAATVALLLPETRGVPLAQTVEEADELTHGSEKGWKKRMKDTQVREESMIQNNIKSEEEEE